MNIPSLKIQDRVYKKSIEKLIPGWVHPNHLTMARFILTPMVIWLVVQQMYSVAVPAFLVVAFTDTLDGSLARIRNQITNWGRIYDPVADKLLIGSMVIILVIQHISVYLGIAILVIEISLIGLGWWTLSSGQVVQANRWGKLKMFSQVVAVTLLLLGLASNFEGLFDISATTFYLALLFAIISLFARSI